MFLLNFMVTQNGGTRNKMFLQEFNKNNLAFDASHGESGPTSDRIITNIYFIERERHRSKNIG